MPDFNRFKNTLLLWVCVLASCAQKSATTASPDNGASSRDVRDSLPGIIVGANRTGQYLPMLKDKKIAVVANQTSVIFKKGQGNHTHLVDSLIQLGISVTKVFSPEHGFRGEADAGEAVADGVDSKTGIPVISLYGVQKKPTAEMLQGVDLILFDIQDVGVRFYTYIATLQYVMEAAAAQDLTVVVLDRPNPNGHYVDGPCMEDEFKGFLGLNNIPLVYGMTIGEYATMINEEGWLDGGKATRLEVVELEHYTHQTPYSLPIRPSPNLPNDQAIGLYPSLGLFEGTTINAGRGTEFQFQRYGSPFLDHSELKFTYTPKPNFGSKHPKHSGALCYGEDLSAVAVPKQVSLRWLIKAYKHHDPSKEFFLSPGMARHAGTGNLQEEIIAGKSEKEIKAGWQECLKDFRKLRARYLRYP